MPNQYDVMLEQYQPMYVTVDSLEKIILDNEKRHLFLGKALINSCVTQAKAEKNYFNAGNKNSIFIEMKNIQSDILDITEEKDADDYPINPDAQAIISSAKTKKRVRFLGRIRNYFANDIENDIDNETVIKIGECFEKAIKEGEITKSQTYKHLRELGRRRDIFEIEYSLAAEKLAQLDNLIV